LLCVVDKSDGCAFEESASSQNILMRINWKCPVGKYSIYFMSGKCRFNEQWLDIAEYKLWVTACTNDKAKAHCKVTHVGGIQNIDVINKQMLLAVGAARQKYVAYFKDEQKKEADKVDHKRKGLIDELKVKKQRLQKDVDSLFRSADDLADIAEKSHTVTCINKLNSLRRSAKEKVSEIQELEQQLDAKLLEMKNMK